MTPSEPSPPSCLPLLPPAGRGPSKALHRLILHFMCTPGETQLFRALRSPPLRVNGADAGFSLRTRARSGLSLSPLLVSVYFFFDLVFACVTMYMSSVD